MHKRKADEGDDMPEKVIQADFGSQDKKGKSATVRSKFQDITPLEERWMNMLANFEENARLLVEGSRKSVRVPDAAKIKALNGLDDAGAVAAAEIFSFLKALHSQDVEAIKDCFARVPSQIEIASLVRGTPKLGEESFQIEHSLNALMAKALANPELKRLAWVLRAQTAVMSSLSDKTLLKLRSIARENGFREVFIEEDSSEHSWLHNHGGLYAPILFAKERAKNTLEKLAELDLEIAALAYNGNMLQNHAYFAEEIEKTGGDGKIGAPGKRWLLELGSRIKEHGEIDEKAANGAMLRIVSSAELLPYFISDFDRSAAGYVPLDFEEFRRIYAVAGMPRGRRAELDQTIRALIYSFRKKPISARK